MMAASGSLHYSQSINYASTNYRVVCLHTYNRNVFYSAKRSERQ